MQGKAEQQQSFGDWLSIGNAGKAGKFLEKLEELVDFGIMGSQLETLYPSHGRPGHAPLVLFKMLLLEHIYHLSDPQCEAQCEDRLSFRKFIGLSLDAQVPDETALVRFRKRLRESALGEQGLLDQINEQLCAKGLILKRVTLVDASLVKASVRSPKIGGKKEDPDAANTVGRQGPHYGYKAHIATDAEHNLIRRASLTAANRHDGQHLREYLPTQSGKLVADKGYDSHANRELLKHEGIADGIMRQARRNAPLDKTQRHRNSVLKKIRYQVEQIFGYWKRSQGYERVRYFGRQANALELQLKCICWNLVRGVKVI